MPSFGSTSEKRLATAHPLLQDLFREVVKHYDCTIVEGHRNKLKQNEYYASGKSKVTYPNGKHNQEPSLAVDAAPYESNGIDWDRDQCLHFGGFVIGTAAAMGIPIRWGGDWDQDNDVDDQTFDDLVHFELVGEY